MTFVSGFFCSVLYLGALSVSFSAANSFSFLQRIPLYDFIKTYPFYCWRTFGLFLSFFYYKQYCSADFDKLWGTCTCISVGIYVVVEWLSQMVCICSALVDIAGFPKSLLKPPWIVYESYSFSTFLSRLSFVSLFNFNFIYVHLCFFDDWGSAVPSPMFMGHLVILFSEGPVRYFSHFFFFFLLLCCVYSFIHL